MKNLSKEQKQICRRLIALLLICVIGLTGALAFLTATDSKENVFTVGSISLELVEEDWVDVDGDGDFEHKDGLNKKILPGHKIPKAPSIKNIGDNDAWVYLTVSVPTMQKDPSRPDSMAISFSKTSIPVVAYGVQDGYGDVTGSENVWNAYYAENVAEKFGNKVTDEAELLNRVEIFDLSELGSGWSQLGDVYKSADGFNYYVFAYEGTEPTLAANTETTKAFEYVSLNKAITESKDVLFSPESASVEYYVKSDIGESKAAELYGVETNYLYSGAIENDYVPEENDAYYVSNAVTLLTFNPTSEKWEVETTSENPVDKDLIPTSILNKNTAVIDPQADPDPNHAAPVEGDEWEDDDYVYKYRYTHNGTDWTSAWYAEWSARVKDTTKISYGPMKNEIWGKKVNYASATFRDCTNLIETPKLSVNLTNASNAFVSCTSLKTINELPPKLNNMTNTFASCTSLKQTPTIPDSVTILDGTFYKCTSLKTVTPLPESIIDMDSAFGSCYSLEVAPKIPSKVTSMDCTFAFCKSLTEAPAIPSLVEDLSQCFGDCYSLVNPPDLSQAISVTDMAHTFRECEKLETAPVIPENVTSLFQTFWRCKALKVAPEIPEKVKNMQQTFFSCSSLTTAPSRIPASVQNMNHTFEKCNSMTSVPDMSDATGVTQMIYTFDSTKITETPNMSNMTSLLDMTGAFARCASLNTSKALPPNVTNMYGTFYQCKNLTGTIRIPASVAIDPNKYLSGLRLCFDDTIKPITLEYYSGQEEVVKYMPQNITITCIDA